MNDRADLVMVVDDDEDVREVTQLVFEAAGYRVRTASDGLSAWRELCRGEKPRRILLDLMMPQMDGEQFLRNLRSSSMANIPVVIMSGHGSAQEKARELQADGCLTKPFDLDQLLATVRRFTAPEHPSSLNQIR